MSPASEIFQRIPCSHLRDPVVICVVVDVISCQSVVSKEDLWRADRIAEDEDKVGHIIFYIL